MLASACAEDSAGAAGVTLLGLATAAVLATHLSGSYVCCTGRGEGEMVLCCSTMLDWAGITAVRHVGPAEASQQEQV